MDEHWQETIRYDPGERRQSTRKQREKGVSIFIPAAELRKAGIDPDGPAPEYKLSSNADKGATVFVRLYRP
jgi:hypothetical protein